MEHAIREAMRGGWQYRHHTPVSELTCVEGFEGKVFKYMYDENHYVVFEWEKVVLDPLFWQALGKALGWGAEMIMVDEPGHPKEWCYFTHCPTCGEQVVDEEEGCSKGCVSDNANVEAWLHHWHRFIDHLAEDKDPESFFTELLRESPAD